MAEKTRRKDPEYLSWVAAIAAKALGTHKETIWGEYHRAQRIRTIFLVGVSALLLALVIALSFVLRSEKAQRRIAVEQRTIADGERATAVRNEQLARRNLYAADINLAQEAWRKDDCQIVLWNTSNGEQRTSALHQKANITAVEFSPDGRSLAAGRWDGTVTLFDAVTLQELLTLEAHRGPVTALAFASDGSALVSGGKDGRIVAWQGSR